jgi:hypothetical protein
VTTCVEHRREQRRHSIEEDHWKEQVRQRGDQAAIGRRGSVVGEHGGEQRCTQHGHDGRPGQEDHGETEQALGVRLAAVRVTGTSPNQKRNHDAREHAAKEELVHHARQGVGEAVVVADRGGADGRADGGGPDEASDPAGDAPQRHDRAVLGDRRVTLVNGRFGRAGLVDPARVLGGAARGGLFHGEV